MTTVLWIALAVVSGLFGFAVGFYAGAFYTDGEFTEYRDDEGDT